MRVNRQEALKIRLERFLWREASTIFNTIKTEFKIGVATGSRTRADAYKARWESTLKSHYKRVQKAFRGAIDGAQKQNDEDENKEDEILAALLLWLLMNAPKQAEAITQTTQKNMDEAMEQARQAFSDEGKTDYSNRELATVASAILGRKFAGRLPGITTLETQAPAESTKLIEAFAEAGLPPGAAVTGETVRPTGAMKTWITMRDERVRAAHRAADGQRVPIEQPFIVKNEKLMFPGDAHLGATIGNLINCRCIVIYSIG